MPIQTGPTAMPTSLGFPNQRAMPRPAAPMAQPGGVMHTMNQPPAPLPATGGSPSFNPGSSSPPFNPGIVPPAQGGSPVPAPAPAPTPAPGATTPAVPGFLAGGNPFAQQFGAGFGDLFTRPGMEGHGQKLHDRLLARMTGFGDNAPPGFLQMMQNRLPRLQARFGGIDWSDLAHPGATVPAPAAPVAAPAPALVQAPPVPPMAMVPNAGLNHPVTSM